MMCIAGDAGLIPSHPAVQSVTFQASLFEPAAARNRNCSSELKKRTRATAGSGPPTFGLWLLQQLLCTASTAHVVCLTLHALLLPAAAVAAVAACSQLNKCFLPQPQSQRTNWQPSCSYTCNQPQK
jgi:hypothetical protein